MSLLKTRGKSEPPEPPRNVRVVHADGSITPLEMGYQGRDEHGNHTWANVHHVSLNSPGDHVEIEELPPRTAIHVVQLPSRNGCSG